MFRDETVITHIEGLEEKREESPALCIMSGPAMGQIHLLELGEYIVGRGKNANIIVLDDAISRQHFKVTVSEKETSIEDLGSTNGTFVNGDKISKQPLKDKDTIQISSQTVMTFSHVSNLEAQKQNQIYKMANFDPVTSARTKYYFLDQIGKEFAHAKRRSSSLSLFMFDIDLFKHVNDTYGHPAGDYVLKKIADMTLQIIRTEDLFARYGGEEFIILMRDTQEREAIRLAERLRQLIALTDFEFDGKRFKVSISGGVASLKENNFETYEELIKTADEYLYFAKENGRNRIAARSLLAK